MTSLKSIAQAAFGNQSLTLLEYNNPKVIFTTDATITESYNKQAAVSTFPIEGDIEGGDNSQVQSFTINISAVTSDATMSYFELVESLGGSPVGGIANALGFEVTSKSQKAWDTLNRWCDDGVPLIVKCSFQRDGFIDKSGKNIPFVLENLNIPKDKNTGSSIRYNFSLRRIKIVDVSAVQIVSTSLGDKGAQGLNDNEASDSVAGQSTSVRTEAPLVDNPEYQQFIFGG